MDRLADLSNGPGPPPTISLARAVGRTPQDRRAVHRPSGKPFGGSMRRVREAALSGLRGTRSGPGPGERMPGRRARARRSTRRGGPVASALGRAVGPDRRGLRALRVGDHPSLDPVRRGLRPAGGVGPHHAVVGARHGGCGAGSRRLVRAPKGSRSMVVGRGRDRARRDRRSGCRLGDRAASAVHAPMDRAVVRPRRGVAHLRSRVDDERQGQGAEDDACLTRSRPRCWMSEAHGLDALGKEAGKGSAWHSRVRASTCPG